jgi:methanogenic corrinoid protein MtbC1
MDSRASGSKPRSGYSIRVVARMTGIPADTLRMWERRYGFPKPSRSANGVRAYGPEDVDKLGLIVRALAAGHRPGQVVPMPQDELERVVAETADPGAVPLPVSGASAPSSLQSVVEALRRSDVLSVHRSIRQAAASLGARAFLTEFAHPLSVRVGELWHEGQIDVRHEHLVTDALTTQIRVLLSTYEDLRGSPSFLLASLPEEQHYLGIQMTALFLSLEGARVHLLGTAAPADQIVRAARDLEVDAVGLSIVRPIGPSELDGTIAWMLDELPRRVELWLGGSGAAMVQLDHPALHRFGSWGELPVEVARLRGR